MKLSSFLLVLTLMTVPAAFAQQSLRLPSGVRVVVVNVDQPQREDGRKSVRAFLAVENIGEYDEGEQSVIADQFFGLYFGPYAEHNEVEVAQVSVGNVQPGAETGRGSFNAAGTYHYERQDNGVWEPRHDSLVDDDPLEKSTKLTLPSGAVVNVEFQGTAYVNVLQGEAFVGAFWTDKPLSDLQSVYPLVREYWGIIKSAIPDNISTGNVAAYDTPKLGHFHFRDALVLTLNRSASGSWPDLPKTWEEVERNRSKAIQATFRKDRIKTIWPDELTHTAWPD